MRVPLELSFRDIEKTEDIETLILQKWRFQKNTIKEKQHEPVVP